MPEENQEQSASVDRAQSLIEGAKKRKTVDRSTIQLKDPNSGIEAIRVERQLEHVINKVNGRYEAPESTIGSNPELLASFEKHNQDVLQRTIEVGRDKGLSPEMLRAAEFCALIHDIAKADPLPDKFGEAKKEKLSKVPYVLAAHGAMGASEVRTLADDKVMDFIFGNTGYDHFEKENMIAMMEATVAMHMGPNPGFMSGVLESVNSVLEDVGEERIVHPKPASGNLLAETLRAADMAVLAEDFGKVVNIRASDERFRKQDVEVASEYTKAGVAMTAGEAAVLSAYTSGEQARDMFPEEGVDWRNVNMALQRATDKKYSYNGTNISARDVLQKQKEFESKKG